MNPMVDMAFLLVSFFMMTTTFKPELPEEIQIPSSTSEIKMPENDICTITISENGVVYFGIDNKFQRQRMLDIVGNQYNFSFTEREKEIFALQTVFGTSVGSLSDYLNAREASVPFVQTGIPMGEQNELRAWLLAARMANPRMRFAVNADRRVKYPMIHDLFELLRDLNITRFNLVTDTKVVHASAN